MAWHPLGRPAGLSPAATLESDRRRRQAGSGQAAGNGANQGCRGHPVASAAATLGVTTEALTATIGGFPPDYAAAATTLGLAEADVQAAVEASLGAMRAGGEGGERGGGAFTAAGLATFARILLPMVIVIAAVSGLRGLWDRSRRRHRQLAAALAGGSRQDAGRKG